MNNFLINIAITDAGEWVANFMDGSITLSANNYHDAVLEADQVMYDNESGLMGEFDYE